MEPQLCHRSKLKAVIKPFGRVANRLLRLLCPATREWLIDWLDASSRGAALRRLAGHPRVESVSTRPLSKLSLAVHRDLARWLCLGGSPVKRFVTTHPAIRTRCEKGLRHVPWLDILARRMLDWLSENKTSFVPAAIENDLSPRGGNIFALLSASRKD